jgi:hypothetical protein
MGGDPKREYLDILLQQYSQTLEFIRNDSNAIWQIPVLLLTAISVLGLAYTQLQNMTLLHLRIARILILVLALGFSLVSLVALTKHRVSCNCKTADFEDIQNQLMCFVNNEINERVPANKIFHFKEIKFRSEDLADIKLEDRLLFGKIPLDDKRFANYRRWFYHRSAYDWQLSFTVLVLFGIASLLAFHLYDFGLHYGYVWWFLIPFDGLALLCFWIGSCWENSEAYKLEKEKRTQKRRKIS